MSLPEIDLARHQRELDKVWLLDEAVKDKSIELMAEDCNPNDPENFVFAIGNLGEKQMEKLGELLEAGNPAAIGQYLLAAAENYWIQESESMAEDILLRERN